MADTHPLSHPPPDGSRRDWGLHRTGMPLREADAAFDRLYRDHSRWVMNLFRRWGDREPEDATQAVFLSEFRARGKAPLRCGLFVVQMRFHMISYRWKQWKRSLRDVLAAAAQFGDRDLDLIPREPGPDSLENAMERIRTHGSEDLATIFLSFPELTDLEAIHLFLRGQDELTSNEIVEFLNTLKETEGHPLNINLERKRWERLKAKLKHHYGIDLGGKVEGSNQATQREGE